MLINDLYTAFNIKLIILIIYIFLIIVLDCSILLTNETGTITSPHSASNQFLLPPAPYHEMCTYAIRLRKGLKIQILIQYIVSNSLLHCCLKIYDGHDSSAQRGIWMRGSSAVNYSASGNEVLIEYSAWRTGDRKNLFKLHYFAYEGDFCFH